MEGNMRRLINFFRPRRMRQHSLETLLKDYHPITVPVRVSEKSPVG